LESFFRNGLGTFWHQSCTAKMGRDATSVVDAKLRVYGVDRLRIADASVLPRVTTGNTMAPCVVIGEMAGMFLQRGRHTLEDIIKTELEIFSHGPVQHSIKEGS
jgi:choline dehydrogenase